MNIRQATKEEMAEEVGAPGASIDRVESALRFWQDELEGSKRRIEKLKLEVTNEESYLVRCRTEVRVRQEDLLDRL